VPDRIEGIFDLLRSLDLPTADHAVFGSGPLIVRGIVEPTNDLDVISRGAAWEVAAAAGDLEVLSDGAVIAAFFGGIITIGTRWAMGDFDLDELIDTSEMIEGIPFVLLKYVVAYKRFADRPKDRAHLASLAAWGHI